MKHKHTIGLYFNEFQCGGGRPELVEQGYNDHLAKDKENFEAFKFCPECGAELLNK